MKKSKKCALKKSARIKCALGFCCAKGCYCRDIINVKLTSTKESGEKDSTQFKICPGHLETLFSGGGAEN